MSGRERRLVFGEVADLYERARPGYPEAIFDEIVRVAGLGPGSRVLEVGCGTGKATTVLAHRDLDVVALEPHPAMAEVARAKLRDAANVRIEISSIEEWDASGAAPFDLVCAFQAWHWVDPEVGFATAARALSGDGWIALVWNWPSSYEPHGVRDALDAAYDEVVPGMDRMEIGRRSAPDWRDAIASSGRFGPVHMKEASWSRPFTTAQYLELKRTQSDHRLLDEDVLDRLLGAVGRIVDDHGGELRINYLCRAFLSQLADHRPDHPDQ